MNRFKHYIPSSFLKEHHLPAEYLAIKYSMSLSTIYRWKKAAENGELCRFKPEFIIDGRMLGILWLLGSDDGERFVVRHKYEHIISEIRSYFNLDSNIIVGRSNTEVQYKLYITGYIRKRIIDILYSLGWTERNAHVRRYPSGNIDHKEFILALRPCLMKQ